MGALSLPKPRNTNEYGRDPGSASERLRAKTNYSKGTGYAPMFCAMIADLPRITRGASCTHLILAILGLQDRTTKDGWTPELSLADWADLAKCDEKEIGRNRDYFKSQGMAECRVSTKRLYSFRLRPEKWEAIQDYSVWLAKQPKPKAEAPAEEPADDSPDAPLKPGDWRMSKPAKVARGAASKPYKIDVGVSQICFKVPAGTPDGVDIEFFSMIKGGSLVVTPTVTLAKGAQKAKNEADKRVKPIPKDMDVLGDTRKRGEKTGESLTVNHPRAGELSKLFDPLLGASRAVLLSSELSSLWAACEAVGDCDHDYLVHFVMERAGRGPVKKAHHAKMICSEALASWKASRSGQGPKRLTQADIDALAEAERKERLARRRK